jgi:hypothetical protein
LVYVDVSTANQSRQSSHYLLGAPPSKFHVVVVGSDLIGVTNSSYAENRPSRSDFPAVGDLLRELVDLVGVRFFQIRTIEIKVIEDEVGSCNGCW